MSDHPIDDIPVDTDAPLLGSADKGQSGHRSHLKRYLAIAFGFGISILSVWWVVQFVGSENLLAAFETVQWGLLWVGGGVMSIGYLLRAWRWRIFFEESPPSFFVSIRVLFVGFFMNNVLPARMGEFVRAHVGGRATDQSRTTVLATIAGERLADGVTISAIFGLLFLFASTPTERADASGVLYVAGGFFAAAILTVLAVSQIDRIFTLVDAIGRRLHAPVFGFLLLRIKRFAHGLKPMFQPRRLAQLVFWSAAIWGMELYAYAQIANAFGQKLSLGALGLFLASVNFSSLIPSAPGALGVIEAFATLALSHVGVERNAAFAMVATQHIIQFIVVGVPGSIFFLMHFRRK